jgi:hypothetical protein
MAGRRLGVRTYLQITVREVDVVSGERISAEDDLERLEQRYDELRRRLPGRIRQEAPSGEPVWSDERQDGRC